MNLEDVLKIIKETEATEQKREEQARAEAEMLKQNARQQVQIQQQKFIKEMADYEQASLSRVRRQGEIISRNLLSQAREKAEKYYQEKLRTQDITARKLWEKFIGFLEEL